RLVVVSPNKDVKPAAGAGVAAPQERLASNSPPDSSEPSAGGDPASYPTRYPWHVTLFIVVSVFFIVSRSAFNVRMHKVEWATELSMYTLPYAFPTSKERQEIREGKSKRYPTLSKRFEASFESFLRFANPIPQEKTRKKLNSNLDLLKNATAWVHSRCEFLGRLIGDDERWTMYSP